MITLRQLEIFAAIIDHGGFRRCAEHLSISPVSVSEHMRALEAQLGVTLFERVKGGPIRPTEAGQRAVEGVHDLLAHVHDFTESIVGEGPDSSPLRIAMHGFMMRNLAPHVAAWNRSGQRPILLRSDESTPEQLHRRVQARDLDVAYFYSMEGMHDFGQEIGREPLAIYVGQSHPLAWCDVVTLDQLMATPSVSLSEDKPLRHVIDESLKRVGIAPLSHIVETAEFGLILSSLQQGMGFTCMFDASRHELAEMAGLKAIPFERPLPSISICRTTRRSAIRLKSLRDALALIERKPGTGGS